MGFFEKTHIEKNPWVFFVFFFFFLNWNKLKKLEKKKHKKIIVWGFFDVFKKKNTTHLGLKKKNTFLPTLPVSTLNITRLNWL